ncbi:pseudouridine synthase Rsu [Phocaeicola salanitronis DSM 18170]|jgi:23S rRNA pseudouridine2605 synthase|uniref:Pseudouridine synthase n=1 Tax=Phocaeicola salanitronis (strain DSM 18170 / JCM 13657 / CCUG 60908 / BL78) TaxID=667015 RepID=F0R2D1_PHOSB|nr:pseudouridine synthase [Phocaeicola salanitronis]ADY36460.1 pseudouridine synthase Rsu [Phocaeicola salanitronis DSM 18170]
MAEKEDRQEGENYQSGRDGYKSYNNREGYNKYNRGDRGNGYERRPRFNSNSDERPQRPYRPRYNNQGEEGGYRPQRSSYAPRYNKEENGEQRPYRPRYNNGPQGEGGYRPQRSSYTPRYNKEENGEQRPYRPRYNNGPQGEGGYRPSRPYNSNQSGGYGRPQGGRPRTADYNPNAKYSKKKQMEYKEVLADPNEPIRLNKFLANAGLCSRREADEFITAGVVSVNGVVVTELGTKVKRSDEVKFHDQPVKIERKVYVLLNKPKDCVTTSDDPQERKTVLDLVKDACTERIYPVGRLDRNTTGVLLLTNDGDLASKLTHPKYLKKKIYHVFLDKNVTKADLDQIASGITLDDGEIHADAISYASDTDKSQVGIEIHSGKNRIVRRIFESLGYRVIKLDRVYFAGLTKKGLRRGDWRYLTEREVNMLRMGAFE